MPSNGAGIGPSADARHADEREVIEHSRRNVPFGQTSLVTAAGDISFTIPAPGFNRPNRGNRASGRKSFSNRRLIGSRVVAALLRM
jgi:hypothetical protein